MQKLKLFFRNTLSSPKTRFRVLGVGVCLLLLLYLTNDFALLTIRQSALVVAIGIDRVGEEVEVSLQIAVPEADDSAQKNHQETVSARADTVSSAIRLCGQTCGWYPVTAFCNFILLGETMLTENVMETLDFFLRDVKVEDGARIAACQGTAKDIVRSSTPLDGVSSFAFEKIFTVNKNTVSTVNPITVKEFAEGCYLRGETAYMPYIRTFPVGETGISYRKQPLPPKGVRYLPSFGTQAPQPTPKNKEKNKGKETENSQNSSSQNAGESEENGTVGGYNASATLIFYHGRATALLDAPQSLCKSMLLLRGKQGVLPVLDVEEDGKTNSYVLNVISNDSHAKLTLNGGVPHLNFRMHLTVKTEDATTHGGGTAATREGYLSPAVGQAATQQIISAFTQMLSLCKDGGCDLFGLHLQLYRRYPHHYHRLKDTLLSTLQTTFDVQVKPLR